MYDLDAKANNIMHEIWFRVYRRKLTTLIRINEIVTCLIQPYVLKYLLNESSREKTLRETDDFMQELD